MTRDELRLELRRIAGGSGPIVLGPWLSEVGFELLYWIPFLRWAVAHERIDPSRLVIVSRGGCRSWYGTLGAHYVELYDRYSPAELNSLNRARIREQSQRAKDIGLRRHQVTAKQFMVTPTERRILDALNLQSAALLHPSLMYRAFRPLWRSRPTDLYTQWREITLTGRIVPQVTIKTDDPYVAVKFYASEACSESSASLANVRNIVRSLAKQARVVLLHTGTAYDEHGEFGIEDSARVERRTFQPSTNLEEQTAIIAGAKAYVGTYGGFAYLAPFLGIPTTTFYQRANFRRDHLRLMEAVSRQRLSASFRARPLSEWTSRLQQVAA